MFLGATKLVSGSVGATVRIWNVSPEGLQLVEEGPSWTRFGVWLGRRRARHWQWEAPSPSIRLLDAESYKKVRTLQGENGFVRTLAWSPDSQTLVSGNASEEGTSAYGDVTFWDPASGKIIERLLSKTDQPVRTVAFDPSGKVVAIGQDNGTVTFVDAASRKPLGDPIKAHNHRVMSIAFRPAEIADALGIAPNTVRNHFRSIFLKLGVHRRVEAVVAFSRTVARVADRAPH